MIMRNRPEKDTVNPPGQIRYLRDVIRKYQEEDAMKCAACGWKGSGGAPCGEGVWVCPTCDTVNLASQTYGTNRDQGWRHSKTGCCHKTVVDRCQDCPYKEAPSVPPVGFWDYDAPTPSTDAEKHLERLERGSRRLVEELQTSHAANKLLRDKLEGLKQALLGYLHDKAQVNTPVGKLREDIYKILKENT